MTPGISFQKNNNLKVINLYRFDGNILKGCKSSSERVYLRDRSSIVKKTVNIIKDFKTNTRTSVLTQANVNKEQRVDLRDSLFRKINQKEDE